MKLNLLIFIFAIFVFSFWGVSDAFAYDLCEEGRCYQDGETCEIHLTDEDNPPGTEGIDNSGIDEAKCYWRVWDNGEGYTVPETTRPRGTDATPSILEITFGAGRYCRTLGGTCTVYVYSFDNAGNESIPWWSMTLNICAGCEIGGVPYDDGDCNPDNECEWCDSLKSTTAWSPIPAGGYICTTSGKAPVSSTNYCETPYDNCDNSSTCTGSRLYRGCTGTGFCSILEENGYKINYPAVCEGLICQDLTCDDPSNCNGHYKTCNATGSCANILNDDSACTADIECGAYCQDSSTCTGYSKRCTGAVNQGSCTTTGQISDPTPCDGLDCGACCLCAAGRSYDSLQDEDCLASGYQCSNPLTCSGHYHQGICTALDSCGLDPIETPDPSQCDSLDCGTCCTCAAGRSYDSTQDADCSVGGYTCTNPLTCSGHYHQGICQALDSCGLDPTEVPDSSQCDGLDCGTCCICTSGRSYDSTQDIDCPAGGGECTDPLACSGYAYQGVCQALDSCGLNPVETPDSSQCDGLDCGTCCLCASGRSYDSLQDEDCLAGGYQCSNPLTCSGHYHQGICQVLDSCGYDPTEIPDPSQCDGLDCGTCCTCSNGKNPDYTQDGDCDPGGYQCSDPLTCSGHYHQGICDEAIDYSCSLDFTEVSDPTQCDGLDCGTCCLCAAGRSYDSLQDEGCLTGGYTCTDPLTCSGHYHQGICQALDSCGLDPTEISDPSQCDGLDCGTCCLCSDGKNPDYTQDGDCPVGGGECSNPLTCSGHYHQGICDEAIDYSCSLDPTEIPDLSQCDGLDCGTCCLCAVGRSYDSLQDEDCLAGGYECSNPLTCSGHYHQGICQALDSCGLDYPTEVPDPSQCDGLDCGTCCLCANGRSYDSLQDEDCLAGGYECSNPLTCSGHYHQGICIALNACTLDSTEVPDSSQCDGLDCGEKSDACDDYCSAKKLVEYNNNCIRDSTPISCDKTCDTLGVCQDCDLPSCPPTVTHCCDGVYNVCGAGCDDDSDCPGESVCQDDCTCSGVRECGPETSICCDGFYWCASGEVFNGTSCASVSSANYCETPVESCDDAPNCQGSKLYKGCSASRVCSDLSADGYIEDYDAACDDESCEDGLWCTINDSCTSGTCSGDDRSCGDLNPCTLNVCNEIEEKCENPPITECYSGNGACVDGAWWDDHCSDGIQDCDEEGIDCGGVDCPPCGAPAVSVTIITRVTVVAGRPPDKPISVGVSWDNCSVQALSIPALHWTYSDLDDVPAGTDPQTAYEIRIKDSSDFPDEPTSDEWRGSGGTGTFYSPSYPSDDGYLWRSWMNWDTDYWWIVRVKDSDGNWSEEWSDPSQFRTPLHAGPWPEFTPTPGRVSLNQVVTFEDNSRCYTFPGNNEFKCQDLPLTSYQWDFDYIEPAFTVNDTTKGNATTFYGDFGNYKVKLRITDDIDACYSKTETVTVTRPLPEWMEIPPF